jgi:hypothetical protein
VAISSRLGEIKVFAGANQQELALKRAVPLAGRSILSGCHFDPYAFVVRTVR